MYCKYCSQRLSGNSIKKCPSCGAAINLYDYGQSFFEDHELDAWKDNTPFVSRTNTEMTTNDGAKMSIPTVQLSSAGMPATPKALNGAVGFFSKHKVSIIISSIAAVLVLVLSIVLVAVLVNKRNEDKGKDTVIDQQQTSGSTLINYIVADEIAKCLSLDFDGSDTGVKVSEQDDGSFFFVFSYNGKKYSLSINPDSDSVKYSIIGEKTDTNLENHGVNFTLDDDGRIIISEDNRDLFIKNIICAICGKDFEEFIGDRSTGAVSSPKEICLDDFFINNTTCRSKKLSNQENQYTYDGRFFNDANDYTFTVVCGSNKLFFRIGDLDNEIQDYYLSNGTFELRDGKIYAPKDAFLQIIEECVNKEFK